MFFCWAVFFDSNVFFNVFLFPPTPVIMGTHSPIPKSQTPSCTPRRWAWKKIPCTTTRSWSAGAAVEKSIWKRTGQSQNDLFDLSHGTEKHVHRLWSFDFDLPWETSFNTQPGAVWSFEATPAGSWSSGQKGGRSLRDTASQAVGPWTILAIQWFM